MFAVTMMTTVTRRARIEHDSLNLEAWPRIPVSVLLAPQNCSIAEHGTIPFGMARVLRP